MYTVTNISKQTVKLPGSERISLEPGAVIKINVSSFSLSLAKLNKLLKIDKFMAVQPAAKTLESSKPAVELNKQKRVRKKKNTSAQTLKISGKVSNDG